MPHCEQDPLVLAVWGASVLLARSCKVLWCEGAAQLFKGHP